MDYITIKEAAESWGVSIRRVNALCVSGKLPGCIRLGSRWLIPKGTERPADGRTRRGRSMGRSGPYRFPAFIYSDYYAAAGELGAEERALLEAQRCFLRGRFEEARSALRAMPGPGFPAHLLAGVLWTLCYTDVFLELKEEYDSSLEALRGLCEEAGCFETDAGADDGARGAGDGAVNGFGGSGGADGEGAAHGLGGVGGAAHGLGGVGGAAHGLGSVGGAAHGGRVQSKRQADLLLLYIDAAQLFYDRSIRSFPAEAVGCLSKEALPMLACHRAMRAYFDCFKGREPDLYFIEGLCAYFSAAGCVPAAIRLHGVLANLYALQGKRVQSERQLLAAVREAMQESGAGSADEALGAGNAAGALGAGSADEALGAGSADEALGAGSAAGALGAGSETRAGGLAYTQAVAVCMMSLDSRHIELVRREAPEFCGELEALAESGFAAWRRMKYYSDGLSLPDGLVQDDLALISLVCRSRSNGEIAELLGMSTEAVKERMKEIYDKFGVSNRYELRSSVREALNYGEV